MSTGIPRRAVTAGLVAGVGAGALSLGGSLVAAGPASAATTRDQAVLAASFSSTVAAYLATRPGSAAVMGFNLSTAGSVAYHSSTTFPTASIVKVDILFALLLRAQGAGRSLTTTEKSLARAMITRSDNAAASSLFSRIGGASGLASANRRLHFTDTVPSSSWGLTRTSARDQIRLLRALTDSGSPLSASRRSYILALMQAVISSQRWGVGKVGTGAGTAVKNGWLPYSGDGYRWIVNSIGRVTLSNGEQAVIAALSRRSPSLATGVATVQQLARLTAAALV